MSLIILRSRKRVNYYTCNYAFTCFAFVVSSSVTNATAVLSLPLVNMEFHSIIVICTIHPNSEADSCKVIAVGVNVNRTGTYVYMYVCDYVCMIVYYVCHHSQHLF